MPIIIVRLKKLLNITSCGGHERQIKDDIVLHCNIIPWNALKSLSSKVSTQLYLWKVYCKLDETIQLRLCVTMSYLYFAYNIVNN